MKKNKKEGQSFWKNFKRQMGLMRTKLIASFVAVLVIPSALIGYFSYQSATEQVRKQMTEAAISNMHLVQSNITGYITPVVNNLQMMSWNFTSELVGTEKMQADLDHIQKNHPELDQVIVANDQGAYSSSPQFEKEGYDPRSRNWYKNSQKSPSEVVISEPTQSNSTGKMIVTISKAFVTGGGSATFNLSLDKLTDSLKDTTIGGSGGLLVLDEQGKVVTGSSTMVGMFKPGQKADDFLKLPKQDSKDIYRSIIDANGYEMEVFKLSEPTTGWDIVGIVGTSDYSDAAHPIMVRAIVVIAISIVIGALIILLMLRLFVAPLKKLQMGTRRVTEGNLTERVPLDKDDEFGELASDFNSMTDALQTMVTNLNQTSTKLAFSSQTIQESIQQTSQSVQHVAQTVQESAELANMSAAASGETAKAVEEMAKGVSTIAESASLIVDSAEHTENEVERGSRSVSEVNGQMERILEAVDESAQMINDLSKLSESASRMNEAIADIAKQTNLLSFNAAIEASRAGEHGRGFAVVATEVRLLAEQSKQTAEDIESTLSQMIDLIEKSTANMNGQVKSQVGEGLRISEEAAAVFRNIEKSTTSIVEQIQDISAVAEEMSASTEEVSATVHELAHQSKYSAESAETTSAAAQEQMAAMEEIEASSHELASMATDLQELVKRFKV
ncbi:methyl-accepting chemotaxis protein [Paenibacillus sp. CAA11]|uniref:methyl-accepting chemotaxis protein n=1 Tax=Paenibacillus sp. CAA11 TaxID=1532905 RepID=UPI000D3892FC|nr:methyl-accepting chemotaxis protein [Paenibacillus sp. CAA11]AWB43652.1 methyl-accepting chemotaxis protein [Paenibacillus sp. CAA11]